MDVFANISKCSEDQWLNFAQLAVFDLMEIAHGLDHAFGPHRNQKIEKITLFLILFFALCNDDPMVKTLLQITWNL